MTRARDWLGRLPGLGAAFRSLRLLTDAARSPFLRYAPPGHYYSCIPDMKDVLARAEVLFRRDVKACPGVDLREREQIRLLDCMAGYYEEQPFREDRTTGSRYYYPNGFFGIGDAIVLYALFRHFRPRRVIEIGSGFSSAAMLDTSERFLGGSVEFTFIEPHADRLLDLLRPEDSATQTIIRHPVQEVPLDVFRALEGGDVLFIDSSHVLKIGSDVQHIIFNVLPAINPGVLIHFHDVHWPFEYRRETVLKGKTWNEAYAVRAFLQFNHSYEILYFSPFMAEFHADRVRAALPLAVRDPGVSLWIRRVT
jgi:predicted O-methyltransferase YrrM